MRSLIERLSAMNFLERPAIQLPADEMLVN
jgi:hypothetical protein